MMEEKPGFRCQVYGPKRRGLPSVSFCPCRTTVGGQVVQITVTATPGPQVGIW